jgi:tetratricopeptide (TPR) repeat protein
VQKFRIDADTWATLNRLLDEALELAPPQLEQWLSTLEPEFEGLKPRLRELLSRTGMVEGGEFLHTLPKLELEPGDLAAAPPAEQSGQEIGPFRLIRELGSGGMGVVWLAQRTDGLVNRPVALKLPHGAWKSAGLAERMAREREILASLSHPNIAHLYDAGITAGGQPYLAIEYVEGRRIDVYCREQALDVKARLRLFAQVANAVAYAHGKLVVHRDLKPANILVDSAGQARLLDFGIAKLLDGGEARESRFTELSGRALTPDYASPEQILGAPLTVQSDVYSLGVVLYELLSEQRPYKLRRDSRGALEDAIVQTEPALPSAVAAAPSRKALRGDLDTVVLKALKKDPTERFATAHAFLDDIERYLGARPVLAQPDSHWYRARKFLARNKLAVGAAAVVFVTVLIGAGVAAWQARVAFAEKTRAEEVKDFIASFFRDADPYLNGGKPLTAIELLKLGTQRMDEHLSAHPRVRAEMFQIIGESALALQDNEAAEGALMQSLQEARRVMPADDPALLKGQLLLAEAQAFLGKTAQAQEQLRVVLATLQNSGKLDSEAFVLAKLQQAHLAQDEARFDEAEIAISQAVATAARVLPPQSPIAADTFHAQADIFRHQGKPDLALASMHKVYELNKQIHRGNALHPNIIDAQMGYGEALAAVGQTTAAVNEMKRSLGNAVKVFGPDAMMVGFFSGHLARVQIGYGETEAAIANARTAVRILVSDERMPSATSANRLRTLGDALLAARRPREALPILQEAVRMSEMTASRNGLLAARTSNALASIYLARHVDAEAELERVIAERASDPPRSIHEPLSHLGMLRRLQSRHADALQLLAQSRAALSDDPYNEVALARVLAEQGLTRVEMGDIGRAVPDLERAHALLTKAQKEMTPLHADALVALGRATLERRPLDAIPLLIRADAFWRDFEPENPWGADAALWLGRCQLALGQTADGDGTLRRAARLRAAAPVPAVARPARTGRAP